MIAVLWPVQSQGVLLPGNGHCLEACMGPVRQAQTECYGL